MKSTWIVSSGDGIETVLVDSEVQLQVNLVSDIRLQGRARAMKSPPSTIFLLDEDNADESVHHWSGRSLFRHAVNHVKAMSDSVGLTNQHANDLAKVFAKHPDFHNDQGQSLVILQDTRGKVVRDAIEYIYQQITSKSSVCLTIKLEREALAIAERVLYPRATFALERIISLSTRFPTTKNSWVKRFANEILNMRRAPWTASRVNDWLKDMAVEDYTFFKRLSSKNEIDNETHQLNSEITRISLAIISNHFADIVQVQAESSSRQNQNVTD